MSYAQKNLNQQHHFFIKYHPELKRFFGSQEAALIFQKSEYWFQKYPAGFWKFFEPCDKHPLYKYGDSWQEELGFSRKVFKRVFAALGIHYKSKSDYLAQDDSFQGKMYASYYDRKTNRTYFLRNHDFVQQFLSTFWQGIKNFATKVTSKVSSTGRSRNVPSGNSFVRALDISLQRSTSSQNQLKSESLCSTTKTKDKIDKNIKIAKDMLNIWNKITLNQQPLCQNLKVKLPQALTKSFQGSLELWTHFCIKVASSKFLMGEAPNSRFKAYLTWLIKPETIEAIEDKYYSLDDRHVNYRSLSDQKLEVFHREEIQGTESWKNVCEQICYKLSYATFKSWFRDLKFLNENTSQPTLYCSTHFRRDWISTHYQSDLERIVKQVLPHTTDLKIDVAVCV